MAELLKNIYSREFFETLADLLNQVLSSFDKEQFLSDIYDAEWEGRELKDRMRHISNVLKQHLSGNYQESVNQLLELIAIVNNTKIGNEIPLAGLAFMFIPDFIERNGIDDFDTSIYAMESITQFASCEFAVRPFIIKYESQMLDQMLSWANHKNEHVRRLASEGSRPRLPWAMALPSLKKDPSPILPILELLKGDESEYVRRSVANSVNDISKDNVDIVVGIAKKWIGKTKEIDWVVKHACRSLLKDGHREVLQLFGFGSVDSVFIKNLHLEDHAVKVEKDLVFSFEIHNDSNKPKKIRLEYGLYFQKKNGSLSRKVFKISEKDYAQKSTTKIKRKQSFRLISTRVYHTGLHKLSLIVNGVEMEIKEFQLVD